MRWSAPAAPSRDAPRSVRLRWIRNRFYLRHPGHGGNALALVGGPTWIWIFFGAITAIFVQGLVSITLGIRREEQS